MLSMEGRKHINSKTKKTKKFTYKSEKKRQARIEEESKGNYKISISENINIANELCERMKRRSER
jgi:hypothetical protein